MFPAASLLSALLLASSVLASPVQVRSSGVTLPLAKRISASSGAFDVVQRTHARGTALKQHSTGGSKLSITNVGNTYYTTVVEVGNPPAAYNLIVDTGTSNTFVGGGKPYVPTSTSVNTNQPVILLVGNDNVTSGVTEWTDKVAITPELVVLNQSIAVASPGAVTSWLPAGVDGTLGIGTENTTLAQGTLLNEPGVRIPTILHNLYVQGSIPKELFSLSFSPPSDKNTSGELLLGAIDSSKYEGDIHYYPVTSVYPSSLYWGLDLSITYDGNTILNKTAGVIDTGIPLVLIATNALAEYQSVTGAVQDEVTGFLKLTLSQYDKLKNLDFHIGSETYVLTPNAQIWPRSLNSYIGGTKDAAYSIISSVGTPSGVGYDFEIGLAFLERFYSVYDDANGRVGFAKTKWTDAIVD